MTQKEIALRDAIERAKSLTGEAQAKAVAELERLKSEVHRERLAAEFEGTTGQRGSSGAKGGADIWDRVKAAGFDPRTNPVVSVGTIGEKTMLLDGSTAAVAPVALTGYGQDNRYVHTAFPSIGLGQNTSVEGLVQSARSLATPVSTNVDIAEDASKPESVVTLTRENWPAKMIATVTEPVSAQVFAQPGAGEWVRSELSHAVALGLDYFIVAALTSATGTNTFSQTTETLIQSYRAALKVARADGYRPTVALLHPTDAYNLDITLDANDRFYGAGPNAEGFGPLWGMKIVESTSVTAGSPILVDVPRLGKLYTGELSFGVNPFANASVDLWRTNQLVARLEVPAAMAITAPEGICEITLL